MQWIVSLTPAAAPDPTAALASPPSGASVIELRADLFPDLDISSAVAACPLPVLVTYRSAVEGGQGAVDPVARRTALTQCANSGAALVDFEWARDRDLLADLAPAPERIVMSWHDCRQTPTDLAGLAISMLGERAALIKVVVTTTSLADLEDVLALTYRSSGISKRDRKRLMAFGMGPIGLPSRFLAPLRGAPIGFCAWSATSAAAPGQPSIEQMIDVVGHLEGPPRSLFGVVGRNVSRSLSPALHAAGYRATGSPDLMVPISVEDPAELPELFSPAGHTLFDRLGLRSRGWAVTTPYKLEAARTATIQAPRVRQAEAANTLILGDQKILAENTDADGVVGSLTAAGISVRGMRAVVQGSGGAARGAAVGLYLAGAEVFIRGRDADRAERVAESIGVRSCAPEEWPDAEILVNATPMGRTPEDPLPFTTSEIQQAKAVVDMVYAAHPTGLVTEAGAAGMTVIDGRTMLAYQGIAQFAAFTGALPPRDAMLNYLS